MFNKIDLEEEYKISSNSGWITALIPISFFLFIILTSIFIITIIYNIYNHSMTSLEKEPLIFLIVFASLSWVSFQFIQKKGSSITASNGEVKINCNGENFKLKWEEIKKVRHIFMNIYIIRLKNNKWFFFVLNGNYLVHIGPFSFGNDPFIDFIKTRIK